MYTIVVTSIDHTILLDGAKTMITKQAGSKVLLTIEPLADLAPYTPVGTTVAYLTTVTGTPVVGSEKAVSVTDGVCTYELSAAETAVLSGVYMLYFKDDDIIFEAVKVNFQ